ncbi:unnamed protein product [Cunninghamella echinulata]
MTEICQKCDPVKEFDTKQKLYSHMKNYHTPVIRVLLGEETIRIENNGTGYICPLCKTCCLTIVGIKKHITNCYNGQTASKSTPLKFNYYNENDIEEDDIDDIPLNSDDDIPEDDIEDTFEDNKEIINISSAPVIPQLDINNNVEPNLLQRTYSGALDYFCQQMEATDNTLKLQPFALVDQKSGVEFNALTNKDTILQINNKELKCLPIIPKQKYFDNDEGYIINREPSINASLNSILYSSPYHDALMERNYIELDDTICTLLNDDWLFRPQMKYYSAQVLAGAILVNENNGQATIINTVEVYGRTKTVDIHRESFGSQKGCSIASSLPPSKTRYPNVWPTTLINSDGSKLVIGTQTFNALITSSLRVDTKMDPSLSAKTLSFVLNNKHSSLATHIFLDKNSIEMAGKLALSDTTTCINPHHLFYQLRQLRTHFHHASTYYLCRASSSITSGHIFQPYTVFTLADFDCGKDSQGRIASELFRLIALQVLKSDRPTLNKKKLECLIKKCNGKILEKMRSILLLFTADEDELEIFENKELNMYLQSLADILSSYLATANKSVASLITNIYSENHV